MEIFKNGTLDADVADALYELGNVGAGKASVALEKLLGLGVTIDIPNVTELGGSLDEVAGRDPEHVALGILMSGDKSFGFCALFLLELDFASDAVYKMTGRRLRGRGLIDDEESLSALRELSGILASAYMNAIGTYSGFRLFLSPVNAGIDMVGALTAYPLARLAMEHERAVCVDTGFGVRGKRVGRVLLLPDAASVGKLADALGLCREEEPPRKE